MFLLKSFLFPLFSPSFYREAVLKRTTKRAFGTVLIFLSIISLIQSIIFGIGLGIGLVALPDEMGEFPKVTVTKEGLDIQGLDMPFEYSDGGQYIGIDTTGTLTEIPAGYAEGILFLKDNAFFRSKEMYGDQPLSYEELLTGFETDEIYFDGEIVSQYIQSFGLVMICVAPLFIFLWQFVTKLFIVFLVTIIGALVLSIMKQDNTFEKSFKISMYALIPVVYISFIFSLLDTIQSSITDVSVASICCFLPLVFGVIKWGFFWGLGAYGVTKKSL